MPSSIQGVFSSPSLVAFLARKLRIITSTGLSFTFCSKPMICPTSPPGFGTGHSRLGLPLSSIVSPIASLTGSTSPSNRFLLLRFTLPSAVSMLSANCRRSTGQGSICGRPTTRKEMASVVVKSVLVVRLRGWRWCIFRRSPVWVVEMHQEWQWQWQ